MAPFEKHCLFEGCPAHPCHGYQPTKSAPVKWACVEHKHLLEKVVTAPETTATESDLFGPR